MLPRCNGEHEVELSLLNDRHGVLTIHYCGDYSTFCSDPKALVQYVQEFWRETGL